MFRSKEMGLYDILIPNAIIWETLNQLGENGII